MSSYQTVTHGDGLPLPLLSIILAPLVCGGPSSVGTLPWDWPGLPGISNIYPLFDYLRSQLGPGELVSLTSYITEWGRSRQRLSNRQLKVDGNKISFKDQAKKLICNHDKT